MSPTTEVEERGGGVDAHLDWVEHFSHAAASAGGISSGGSALQVEAPAHTDAASRREAKREMPVELLVEPFDPIANEEEEGDTPLELTGEDDADVDSSKMTESEKTRVPVYEDGTATRAAQQSDRMARLVPLYAASVKAEALAGPNEERLGRPRGGSHLRVASLQHMEGLEHAARCHGIERTSRSPQPETPQQSRNASLASVCSATMSHNGFCGMNRGLALPGGALGSERRRSSSISRTHRPRSTAEGKHVSPGRHERSNSEDRQGDQLLADFLARVVQQKRSWRDVIIDPKHWLLKHWHLLQLMCVIVLFYDVTLSIAFFDFLPSSVDVFCNSTPALVRATDADEDYMATGMRGRVVLNVLVDSLLLLHMALQFRLGFIDAHNNRVMDRSAIKLRYMRSWRFVVHVAAALPLDMLRLLPIEYKWPDSITYEYGQVTIELPSWDYVLTFSRILKLARVFELPNLLKRVETDWRVPPHVRRLFALALAMALIAQLSACSWFFIGKILFFRGSTLFFPSVLEKLLTDTAGSSSAVRYPPQSAAHRTMQYFDAMYFTLGLMTGLADGEEPQSWLEMAFTVILMFIGIFVFAVIIGSVSTIVGELSEAESDFQNRRHFMSQVLKQNRLPTELERRVLAFYSYQWKNHQGFDDFKVLASLPSSLRTDVMLQLTRGMIENVPFFKGAEDGFVLSLVDRLKPRIAAEAELVCAAGEVGNEMYFVHRGELDVLVGKDALKVAKLRQGDYFGEGLLINRPRTNSVRAATFCDLFTLTRNVLEEVLPYYPQTAETFRRLVYERVEEDLKKERQAWLTNKYGKRLISYLISKSSCGERLPLSPQFRSKGALGRVLKRGNSCVSIRCAAFLGASEGKNSAASSSRSTSTSQSCQPDTDQTLASFKDRKVAAIEGSGCAEASSTSSDNSQLEQVVAEHKPAVIVPPILSHSGSVWKPLRLHHGRRGLTKVFPMDPRASVTALPADSRKLPLHKGLSAMGVEAVPAGMDARNTHSYAYIVLPGGGARRCWASVLWLALMWNIVSWPYGVSFRFRGPTSADAFALRSVAAPGAIYVFDALADLAYLVDVPLSLRLAFVNDQGVLVTDSRQIVEQFRVSGRMRLSLLSLLPMDWLFLILALVNDWDARLTYVAVFLRIIRLVRALDFPDLSMELYIFFADGPPNFSLQRILSLVWSLLLCTHLVACAAGFLEFASPNQMTFSRYSFARDRCFAGSMPTYPLIDDDDGHWAPYWRAIYFAMGNLSGLGRGTKPESIEEHVLSLLVWFMGIFFVAFVVGSIGQLSSNWDASEVKFRKTFHSVKRYMKHQRLSPDLHSRADRFFEYLWAKTQGIEIGEVVDDLNFSLRTEVLANICRDAVNSVPLFKDRGAEFIDSVVQVLSFQSFPQGEWLMRKHTIGSAMYLILKGEVDIIVSEDLMFVTATLGVGDFVGEGALLKAQGKCGASVRARTTVDTMVLTKEGFSIVLARFPDIRESIRKKFNERNKENTAANKALDRRLDELASSVAAKANAELADVTSEDIDIGHTRLQNEKGIDRDGYGPAPQARNRKRCSSTFSFAAPLLSDSAKGGCGGNESGGAKIGVATMLCRSNSSSPLGRSSTIQVDSAQLVEALARRPSLMREHAQGEVPSQPKLTTTIRRVRGANHAIRACRAAVERANATVATNKRDSLQMPNAGGDCAASS